MNKVIIVKHRIQKHIIDLLTYKETAHFSELRPPRVDTNLFSYHLKSLIDNGLVTKHDKAYGLGTSGLAHVDQMDTLGQSSLQPGVLTMLLIQDSDGRVLLWRRQKQPYVNTWTLPYGKVHTDDSSIQVAAKRQAQQLLGLQDREVRHVGDCYIRVSAEGRPLSTTFVHVFRFETDKILLDGSMMWIEPIKLGREPLAPAVEQIIARSFFGDEYFFAEFEHEWVMS